MARIIAFYLPQFYPTPENDEWWEKGFTEWTNVRRAKPLFKGHYQPRVPAEELGYYDLRDQNVRIKQAELARLAGIEGFCYWHYWFAGRRLLNRVFDEVVQSGIPDYPFCLCWANHTWYAKRWNPKVQDKILIEQTYPGKDDYERQFYTMLPAFKDKRYIKVDGRLLYGIFSPTNIPDIEIFTSLWNSLANKNGLPGFYFFALSQGSSSLANYSPCFDSVVFDPMYDAAYCNRITFKNKVLIKFNPLLNRPVPMTYDFYSNIAIESFVQHPETVPCIIPNFDHSPRSGSKEVIIHDSTPEKWGLLCEKTISLVEKRGGERLVFIKAWNEWGEGNYLEPDCRFGRDYLQQLARIACRYTY